MKINVSFHFYSSNPHLSTVFKLPDNQFDEEGICEMWHLATKVADLMDRRDSESSSSITSEGKCSNFHVRCSCKAIDFQLDVTVDSEPWPIKEHDCARLSSWLESRRWWIHHVDVDNISFDNVFDAENYLEYLVEHDFNKPSDHDLFNDIIMYDEMIERDVLPYKLEIIKNNT